MIAFFVEMVGFQVDVAQAVNVSSWQFRISAMESIGILAESGSDWNVNVRHLVVRIQNG